MSDKKPINSKQLEVQTPVNLRGGVYANTVNISASNSEATINFIYSNPSDEPEGTLVSRVIVPLALLEKLPEILSEMEEKMKGINK